MLESFLPDPTWENFSRPPPPNIHNQKKEQLGFGFPKYGIDIIRMVSQFPSTLRLIAFCRFVTHEMLGRRNYIKDDTLFLKIRADPKKGVCV